MVLQSHTPGEPARKRQKLDTKIFKNAEEIKASLQNLEARDASLVCLRNQLMVRPGEIISPQDPRLSLLQNWLQRDPGLNDLFTIWQNTISRQTSLLSVIVSLLSSTLTLLSSHYMYHTLGQPLVKTLLTPVCLRRLNSYIGGSHNELIIVTLKLFLVISTFGGGKERKAVLEGFGWEIKSLPKLLNMRRKSKHEEGIDPLAKPDIRTLYILLLLSFFEFDSPAMVKTAFLEQHREVFFSIFKGLVQDHYSVIRKVLEVCWAGLWSDPKVKRSVKISLFNETTITHLIKIYDRVQSDDDDSTHIPADVVHHFLLAICTRPGVGICFKDRGWYLRDSNPEDEKTNEMDDGYGTKGGKIHNKILSNILKTLKVNEDSRQQELALKILSSCPELVAGYWAGAALTMEPRRSSKWIANIAFFGTVISLPVPSPSFLLPDSTLFQPTPPPLHSIIENILPFANNTKVHFSKGLQSSFGIVQHCTALALAKVFTKYHSVIETFSHIAMALEEDPEDGQWSRRLDEVKIEVRRRVPEFQVIVAFSQQKVGEVVAKGQSLVKTNPTKEALLLESAQRLLWMYQSSLPSVVGEARFDVGKLLQTFSTARGAQTDIIPNAAARLHHLRQLHILRLLKESDQFSLIGKSGSSSSSYLHILLTDLTSTEVIATRSALSSLLEHILSQSIIFQDGPDEPKLWLISLPRTRRGSSAESPDGALLTNEAKSVVNFLDDAVQRCVRNPYKYIEELQTLERSLNPNETHNITDRLDAYPSPLIMAVLEQLDAKVRQKTLSPSDLLALASFIRKVLYRLSSRLQDLQLLTLIFHQFDHILSEERRYAVGFPVMTAAIRREVEILAQTLRPEQVPMIVQEVSEEVKSFLAQVDKISIPLSEDDRIIAAYELIDWLRLVNQPLGPREMKLVTSAVMKFHPVAMQDIFENLAPLQALWRESKFVEILTELHEHIPFEWLFLQLGPAQILDKKCREVLLDSLFAKKPSPVQLKGAIRLIGHRIKREFGNDVTINGLCELLALVMKMAIASMAIVDAYTLKELVFMRSGVLKDSLMLAHVSETVQQGISKLVESSLDPASPADRQFVHDICDHWFNTLKSKLMSNNASELGTASIWINYFGHDNLLDFLDDLGQSVDAMSSQPVLDILQRVLVAIKLSSSSDAAFESALRHRLPQLLSLRPVLYNSAVLEDMISVGIEASIPIFCDRTWLPLDDSDGTSILSIISRVEARWSQHRHQLPIDCSIQHFLSQKQWSDSTVKIISGLLYSSSISHPIFLSWLATPEGGNRDIIHLIPVIYAFLESSRCRADLMPPTAEVWAPYIPRLVDIIADNRFPRHLRISAGSSVFILSQLLPSHSATFIEILSAKVNSQAVTAEIIALGSQFCIQSISVASPLIMALIDIGMQWVIRQLADEYNFADVDEFVHELASLVKSAQTSKAHLVETLLAVIIQDSLSNKAALELAKICLSTTSLKPLVVNRHLQSIVQHTQFFKLCNAESTSLNVSPRDAIIDLLSTLFHLHPSNTCQVSHIEPLIRVYHGTVSKSDLQLLSILRLFESQRKLSIAQLFNRWSAAPGITTATSLEALQSLDTTLIQRTSLHFPNWRSLHGLMEHKAFAGDNQLYDPVFLLLLFGQMLADNPPTTTSAWIGLFRTNIVSLFIRALSAKDAQLRDVALCQLTALWKLLQATQLQESPHVLHILNLLKNVLPRPSHEPCIRLPSFMTLTLCHALKGIFYPSSFIYPLTARFLLQRPELDTHDVPMLYGMLYSSSDDWKKDRGWIIRSLSDGLMNTDDWRIFRRRHTWEIIASLFQGSNANESLRNGILEVLANLTCNRQATISLILKSNLLTWIEAQLIHSTSDTLGWIRVLENILVTVDPEKIETHTNREWRSVVCRCLSLLLGDIIKTSSVILLPAAVSVVLRLSLLPGDQVPGLSMLVQQCTECLKIIEKTLRLSSQDVIRDSKLALSQPPHTAIALHILTLSAAPLQVWGSCVEMLWRVAMSAEEKLLSWDALTSRLLLLHTLGGGNSVGEWARTETIRNFLV